MGVAGDAAAAAAGRKRGTSTRCELCGGAAAVHCAADSAFLCLRCDAKVHGANFLASRHLRRRLPCQRHAAAESSGGASSASSTSCVSTAVSAESTAAAGAPAPAPSTGRAPARRQRPRAEAVLEGWAKRMGFATGPARRHAATAASALRALGRGVAAARVPLRVAMAAALWSEVAPAGCRRGNGGDAALLRRLEAAAHVPARLVLTVASWMSRAGGAARRPAAGAGLAADGQDQDHEEGWAECS